MLKFLATICIIVLIIPIFVIGFFIFVSFFATIQPSASFKVEKVNAEITSNIIDGTHYLIVKTPQGEKKEQMFVEWKTHPQRKSLFLTADGHVVLLSSLYNALIRPKKLIIEEINEYTTIKTDGWVYLGAFDFYFEDNIQVYRFIPARKQAECIPSKRLTVEEKVLRVGPIRINVVPLRPTKKKGISIE